MVREPALPCAGVGERNRCLRLPATLHDRSRFRRHGVRMARDLTFDLYVWKTPRDVDADRAETLLRGWHAAGADPRESPFEANSDVGWYHRELTAELPTLDITSDAVPSASTRPVWLSTTDEPPARIVAIRLAPAMSREALGSIAGLAAK